MRKSDFHKRSWLNPPSGGDSYVIIHGEAGELEFVLADCTRHVSIHSYSDDVPAMRRYVKKLLKIRSHLDMLIEYVELRIEKRLS